MGGQKIYVAYDDADARFKWVRQDWYDLVPVKDMTQRPWVFLDEDDEENNEHTDENLVVEKPVAFDILDDINNGLDLDAEEDDEEIFRAEASDFFLDTGTEMKSGDPRDDAAAGEMPEYLRILNSINAEMEWGAANTSIVAVGDGDADDSIIAEEGEFSSRPVAVQDFDLSKISGDVPGAEELLRFVIDRHVLTRPTGRLPLFRFTDPHQLKAWNAILEETAFPMKYALDVFEESGFKDVAIITRMIMLRQSLALRLINVTDLRPARLAYALHGESRGVFAGIGGTDANPMMVGKRSSSKQASPRKSAVAGEEEEGKATDVPIRHMVPAVRAYRHGMKGKAKKMTVSHGVAASTKSNAKQGANMLPRRAGELILPEPTGIQLDISIPAMIKRIKAGALRDSQSRDF